MVIIKSRRIAEDKSVSSSSLPAIAFEKRSVKGVYHVIAFLLPQ